MGSNIGLFSRKLPPHSRWVSPFMKIPEIPFLQKNIPQKRARQSRLRRFPTVSISLKKISSPISSALKQQPFAAVARRRSSKTPSLFSLMSPPASSISVRRRNHAALQKSELFRPPPSSKSIYLKKMPLTAIASSSWRTAGLQSENQPQPLSAQ